MQAVLNNRTYAQRNNNPPQIQQSSTQVNQDSSAPQNNFVRSTYQSTPNSSNNGENTTYQAGPRSDTNQGNLYVAQELGYTTPMNAEDQIKLASKYMDKNLEKDTAITGIASLTNAFGRTGGFSTVFGSYTPR